MKDRLPCELIQDLFPSYIDGLTSEVTNEMVKEHIEECQSCKDVLEAMKEPSGEPVNPADEKEIDFLKKNKKRNQKIMMGSILVSIILIIAIIFVRTFLIGSDVYNEMVTCEAKVEGTKLSVDGVIASESLEVSDIDFEERDGVIFLSFRAVRRNIFSDKGGEFSSEFEAKQNITRVCIGERIIWDQGESISAITSAVYHTRHAYIGDMSANGRTAKALNMQNYLGDYTNELQTDKEPYEWKFILQEESTPDARQKERREAQMRAYGYILLAVVENVGKVSYEYEMNGESCTVSITTKDAGEFAGHDIKECGQDIGQLQRLIEKTGLDGYAYGVEYYAEDAQNAMQIEIVNNADDEITGIELSYFVDGKDCGLQGGANADGSSLKKGAKLTFSFLPNDFGDKHWSEGAEVKMKAAVLDESGNTHELKEPFLVAPSFGVNYTYTLSGNAKDGYVISQ